jgi:hypothetical protein
MMLHLLVWTALAAPVGEPSTGGGLAGVAPPADAALIEAAAARRRTERRGMAVLATWAGANLATAVPGALLTRDPRVRSFWQGNAAWNVVNLGIAASGLLRDRRAADDAAAAAARADALDRALLLNIGLDVAYIAGGWALQERGARTGSASLLGWGDALTLQGGFLLGFDVALFAAHQRWSRRLRRARLHHDP